MDAMEKVENTPPFFCFMGVSFLLTRFVSGDIIASRRQVGERKRSGEWIMIRKFEKNDIDRVAELWLETNICAHDFISEMYWKDNFDRVKELFLQAEIYVYEDAHDIQGFVGLDGNYIAGIFVSEKMQSGGIGRQLLDYVKSIRKSLSLKVYRKNIRAVKFYQREKFQIQNEGTDADTGEKEYLMTWRSEEHSG